RVLHVPRGVHRLLRRPRGAGAARARGARRARRPRRRPSPRRARRDDRAPLAAGGALGGDRRVLHRASRRAGVHRAGLAHAPGGGGGGGRHRARLADLLAPRDQRGSSRDDLRPPPPRRPRRLLARRPLRRRLSPGPPRLGAPGGLGGPLSRGRGGERLFRVDARLGRPPPPHADRSRAGLRVRARGGASPPPHLGPVAAMSPVPVPILSLITWMPFLGAVLIMFAARHNPLLVRLIAVVTTGTSLLLSLRIFWLYDREAAGYQFYEELSLVPPLGISYQVGVDGMSLLMELLTSIIIFAGVWASWTVKERSQEFYALLLLLVTGVYGVFVSLDLFVLFLFYEIAVLPMYLLIGIWGSSGEVRPQGIFGWAFRRTGVGTKEYAAMKLTLYLLFGSA